MGILGWILFGLLAGAVARTLTPGRHSIGCFGAALAAQGRDPRKRIPTAQKSLKGPLRGPGAGRSIVLLLGLNALNRR